MGKLEVETSEVALGDGNGVLRFCKKLHEQGYVFKKGDHVSRENPELIEAFAVVKKHMESLNGAVADLFFAADGYEAVYVENSQKTLAQALDIIANSKNEKHLLPMQKACKKMVSAFYGSRRKLVKLDDPAAKHAIKGLSTLFKRSYGGLTAWKLCKDATGVDQADERYVLGVVLEPTDGSDGQPIKPDTDKDVYSAEEVRKAAHWYMEHGRKNGIMHGPENGGVVFEEGTDKIVLLETYITPVDIPSGVLGVGIAIKKGTWLMALRINDDLIWQSIKDGTLNGLSIGGIAYEYEFEGE